MAEAAGEAVVTVLLRALPPDVAEQVLGRLDPGAADRVRARLRDPATPPPAADDVDAALAQFFDTLRIASRPTPAPGEYRPTAAPADPAKPADPADELRALPPDRLARALDGEPPGAIAMLLGCLEPAAAGLVMRRLHPDLRSAVALRLSRPLARNPAVLAAMTRTVVDKARRLADVPAEPTEDERINALAEILRALPRADRSPVLSQLETANADLAAAVRDKLYRIEDLLRVPDRQLQVLLAELDVRRLAVAIKGAGPEVLKKVTANMSSRAKTVLTEESELLGDPPASTIKEARSEVFTVFRRLEEEGRIKLEE